MITTENASDAIAVGLSGFGGVLRCTTCKAERPVRDVAGKLRNGWPRCCGYTMSWITRKLLAAEATALLSKRPGDA